MKKYNQFRFDRVKGSRRKESDDIKSKEYQSFNEQDKIPNFPLECGKCVA